MKNSLFSFVLFYALSTLLYTTTMVPSSLARPADPPETMPAHTVSISFDLKKSELSGTSRIDLPANTPLALHCGPLTITGAILERPDRAPLRIKANLKNIIRLNPVPDSRALLISWTMAADNPFASSNLITKNGITLAGFWHPMPEQDMLYTLEAILPPGFTGISEGEQISTTKRNGQQQFEATFPYPLRGLHFAAGPYSVQTLQYKNIKIYSYFFAEDNHLAAEYLRKAAGYIKRFEALIGPFPYSRYSIVENRLPTGYGMPGFTLLGQTVIRLPFIKDTSLGHEILHSWFGNSIGLAESGGNWCEGLTSYLADQSFAQDKDKGREYRKHQLLRYEAFVHPDNTMPLSDFSGAGDNQPMAKAIRSIGYDKGSMVFHMLNKDIGDAAFFQGLKELYVHKKNQRASWQDLKQAFSRAAGKDLQPFFSQWLERTDIPKLSIEQVSLEQENGQSVVTFHLKQGNEQPYALQIPVLVKTLNNERRLVFSLNQLDQEFSIITETLPTEIVMDPDYDVFRALTEKEIPPTWSRFLGAEQKTIILADDEARAAVYQPLADMLQARGVDVKTASEISNQDLATGSFLFAGDSRLRRNLFADTANKDEGFSLQVRKNPLEPGQTMVLVDSSSASETSAILRKLSHYGKYSSLYFKQGQIIDKMTAPSEDGLRLSLLPSPPGIPTQAALDFSAIIKDLEQSRVVYAGETHTDYGDHLQQLQILQALYVKNKQNLAIGMEMFPRSSQPALDAYIGGKIATEKEFIKASKYFSVWGYDYRLYRDIIGFARKNNLPIIGLNLDKKIVSQVFKEGNTDTIGEEDLATIAKERDLDVPGYRERLTGVHSQHKSSPHGDTNTNSFGGFLQAQAMWDETMAESITNYLQDNPEKNMIVIAGAGHVYKDSAIPLRVQRRMPEVRQSVLISDNGMDTGRVQGKQVDYLMFPRPVGLSPAPKVGVALKEEKETETGKADRIRIVGISPHGDGTRAGLKEQDIILSVDGTPVHDVADLKIALLDKEVGETVTLQILRERDLFPDETLEISLKLTSMQAAGMMMPPGHPKK